MARFDSDFEESDFRLLNGLEEHEDNDDFNDLEEDDFLEEDLDEDFFDGDLSDFEDDGDLKDIFDPGHEDLDLEDDMIDFDDEF